MKMYCSNLFNIIRVHAKWTFDLKLMQLNINIICLRFKVLIVNKYIRDQGLNLISLTLISFRSKWTEKNKQAKRCSESRVWKTQWASLRHNGATYNCGHTVDFTMTFSINIQNTVILPKTKISWAPRFCISGNFTCNHIIHTVTPATALSVIDKFSKSSGLSASPVL